MDTLDLSYLAAVSLAGAGARACVRGVAEGWRVRLEATVPDLPAGGWIWLHAVSVGELLLGDGLLGRLRDLGHRIHVTTGTPAGLALLAKRLPAWDAGTGRVSGGAFPLDDPAGLAPFLAHPPAAFVALETELWPNLLRVLEARGVPRCIVNGRLTERSLARGGPWLRRAASRLTLVAARDPESVEAFCRLGAPMVALGGNLKADLPPPPPLHAGWTSLRTAWARFPVLVAGNTLEGEEDLVLSVWEAVRADVPELRLILAPRQPRRFQAVATALLARGVRLRRASDGWPDPPARWEAVDVLLLDTLGELSAAYGEGTLALVGGGWRGQGGHNPLEPVRAGVPTLLGPGFDNFIDLVPPLVTAGRVQVVGEAGLADAIRTVLRKAALRPSPGAGRLPEALIGALGRTLTLLEAHIPTPR